MTVWKSTIVRCNRLSFFFFFPFPLFFIIKVLPAARLCYSLLQTSSQCCVFFNTGSFMYQVSLEIHLETNTK